MNLHALFESLAPTNFAENKQNGIAGITIDFIISVFDDSTILECRLDLRSRICWDNVEAHGYYHIILTGDKFGIEVIIGGKLKGDAVIVDENTSQVFMLLNILDRSL